MLRRAAIYGAPNSGAGWQKCYSALFFALEQRFGKNRIWRRTTRFIEPSDVADDVAIAFVLGSADHAKDYVRASEAFGVPTLVVDEGWLRLERGYWRVNVGWVDHAPPRAPSSDRFEALQLKIHERVEPDNGTIILGEDPLDNRHDLNTDADVMKWGRHTANSVVRPKNKKHRVFWRPNKNFIRTLGPPSILMQHDRLIGDVIKFDHVGSAVAYNSALALDFLRQGVRVVAQGPRTVYTDLVPSDLKDLETAHPGTEKIRELFTRLAYGQYKLSELSMWSTMERLMDIHGIAGDW